MDSMQIESSQDFATELAQMISYYLEDPKHSLQFIENKTSVAKSYVYRLSLAEIEPRKMDTFKVFVVLKFILGFDRAKQFLLESEISDKFKTTILDPLNCILDQVQVVPPDCRDIIFSSNETFLVFALSINTGGARVDDIWKLLGNSGIDAVNYLTSNRIVKVEDGICKENISDISEPIVCSSEAIKFFPYLVSLYDKRHQDSAVFLLTQNVNDRFIRVAKLKLMNVFKELTEEVNKLENQGDIPFFITGVLDTLREVKGN